MSVLPPSDRDRLTVNRITGPGDMSAVRAAIVAMTAGPPPLPAPQSPLHGNLADLPPLLIAAGGDEALLDDARRFANAASAAGTLVTLDIYQDMVHAFHLSALPETPPQVAITFLDRLTAWTTALRHPG
jgi:epsilon-lactone hydrolase